MKRAISNWSYWDNSVQVNLEQEQEVSKEVQEQEVVEQKEAPEYTTIVYQDKVGVGQIYFSFILASNGNYLFHTRPSSFTQKR